MPLFARSGGAWVESIPHVRSGAAWTDEDDQLFVRDAAEWKLIYPDPADAGDLLPVEGLAVTAGPTHFSVTIGWTNPTQPTIEPTEVEVRIAELGAVWTRYDYPVTEASWGALEESTEYFAQVRLIRVVDGLVTDTSPIKSVQFTTDAAPVGPAAEDPASPGGTSTEFPVNIPIGGSVGGGDPVSTTNGCWGEYKIQILNQDTTTIDWQETGITGTFSGAASSFVYDTTALDNTRTYRTCVREACDTTGDGTADTFGAWSCSEPYPGKFDWGVTCGNIPNSPVIDLAAAADAVWAFPAYCNISDEDTGVELIDTVSNTEIGRGADAAAIYTTTDGEWGVVADSDGGITLTAGLAAVATAIGATEDFTIATRYRFSTGHTLSNGRTLTIASIGQGAIVFRIVETATGWYPTVSFRLTSGYVTLSGSASEASLDDDVHTIALRWDADGDKKLALDATQLDADTSGNDLHASVSVQPMYWTQAHGFGSTMQQIGWDRILSDAELETLGVAPEVTAFAWASGAGSSTVDVSALADDKLMVAVAYGTEQVLTPSGWTLVGNYEAPTSGYDVTVWTRVKQAADTTFVFDKPGVNNNTACVVVSMEFGTAATLGSGAEATGGAAVAVPAATGSGRRAQIVMANNVPLNGEQAFTGYPAGYSVVGSAYVGGGSDVRIEFGYHDDNGGETFNIAAGPQYNIGLAVTIG